jgi:hypothetical protein
LSTRSLNRLSVIRGTSLFLSAFLRIENDNSLPVLGRLIRVFVPVGTLQNQRKKSAREAFVESVHGWIESHRFALPDGTSQHRCAITGIAGTPPEITLTVKAVPLRRGSVAEPGTLHVRRQQVEDNLDQVIEKALRMKLPKLVNTVADKRILLLERQHMNLSQLRMLDEIERRRPSFPGLESIDEIWILETIFYGTAFGGSYLRFELFENGNEVGSFDFDNGKLMMKFENGVAEVIRPWT